MTIPGIEDIIRQAQTFGKQMAKIKEELARETVTGSAGGGMVTAQANGRGQILKIGIEPQVAAEKTRQLTGGLPIPGIEGLFSGGM